MIIGIDASRANQTERTGTEWYSYILLKKFAELDQKNQFRLYVKNPPSEDLLHFGDNFQVKKLGWPISRLWHQGRLSLEMMMKKPDVLFVPAHTIPLIHPEKTVTTCHDIGFEKFPELYSPAELKYHRWSMNFAIKNARKIITVSEFSKQEIINTYKCKAGLIEVVYHGVNHDFFRTKGEQETADFLKTKQLQQPYLFFVGRIEKKKNLVNQIRAFSQLKKLYQIPHQLLLGGNLGFGSDEIVREIARSDYQNDIKLIGYVKSEDLPFYYSGADVFMFATNYEGFGMPILEAQAAKTPVLASRVCSIPEVAGQGASFVNPKEVASICQGVYQIISNRNYRNQLVEAGLANARKFDWLKTAQKTLSIIQNL
ncbi:glycosyltransferase family 4 protein [Patescibacteria group bacterium]|nr:glycosyltransferase family 4 protein [Patescibacteria group bacterium]